MFRLFGLRWLSSSVDGKKELAASRTLNREYVDQRDKFEASAGFWRHQFEALRQGIIRAAIVEDIEDAKPDRPSD